MNDFEQQIKDLAQKGLDAQAASWPLRLLSLVVFFALLWWTQYQLSKKEKELAEAKAYYEKEKLQREWEAFKAEAAQLDAQVQALTLAALAEATAALARYDAAQRQLDEQKAKVDKIANWEDLNALAGVTP